jgi:hypothetical protein
MIVRTIALAVLVSAAAAAQSPAPYSAVEVDPFLADRGSALVEDIAREISVVFKTVIILRQGDAVPFGHAVLRISGTVVRFKLANKFQVQVRFADASTGQVLLIRKLQGASKSIGRKIAKLCAAHHFINSK